MSAHEILKSLRAVPKAARPVPNVTQSFSPAKIPAIPPEFGISLLETTRDSIALHPRSIPSVFMSAHEILKSLRAVPKAARPAPNVVQSLLPAKRPANPPEFGIFVLASTRAPIALHPESRPCVFIALQSSANAMRVGISASMFSLMRVYILAFCSASFILNFPANRFPRASTRLDTESAVSVSKPSSSVFTPFILIIN